MWPNPQGIEDVVTFTEEILYGKLHFLCSKQLIPVAAILHIYIFKIISAERLR